MTCDRSGQTRRKWVKVSTIVLCGSLLPLSLVLDWGPGNDKCQAQELVFRASEAAGRAGLYADAGYDAEWVHDQCRLEWECRKRDQTGAAAGRCTPAAAPGAAG